MIENLAEILREINDVADREGLAEPYLVGGAVRDMLLGIEPGDYDITCGGPDALILADKFAAEKRVPVHCYRSGAKRVRYQGYDFDFSPHAIFMEHDNPFISEVFSRDFTINSMLIRCADGQFIDLCDGVKDLEEKNLRCTYSSEVTFKNNANAMRGVKLIGQGYKASPEVEKGIVDNFHKISNLPYGQAAKVMNRIIRQKPEMLEWLVERGLLEHLPKTRFIMSELSRKRMLSHA